MKLSQLALSKASISRRDRRRTGNVLWNIRKIFPEIHVQISMYVEDRTDRAGIVTQFLKKALALLNDRKTPLFTALYPIRQSALFSCSTPSSYTIPKTPWARLIVCPSIRSSASIRSR